MTQPWKEPKTQLELESLQEQSLVRWLRLSKAQTPQTETVSQRVRSTIYALADETTCFPLTFHS